jgi:hypothetical protein
MNNCKELFILPMLVCEDYAYCKFIQTMCIESKLIVKQTYSWLSYKKLAKAFYHSFVINKW